MRDPDWTLREKKCSLVCLTDESIIFHNQSLLWQTGTCTKHTSQSHRTPIMTGGFTSNRDGRRPVRSVRAGSNASALSSVLPPIEKSRRYSISNQRVTSATRAVAWDSDGTLNDPHKSDSTRKRSYFMSICRRIIPHGWEFI